MAKSAVPEIYDVQLDELRPITQKDVDRLTSIATAYGRLSTTFLQMHWGLFPNTPLGKAIQKHLRPTMGS